MYPIFQHTKPHLGARLNPNHPLAQHLVGWWLMNEGRGTDTVYDLTENKNHGTINGNPTWAAGKFGSALSFDGTSDYITAGDIDLTNEITISAYVKQSSIVASNKEIVSKSDGSSKSNYTFRLNNGKIIFIFYEPGAETWHEWKTSATEITASTWSLVTVSYVYGDGSSIAVYVDGVSVDGEWTTGDGDASPYTTNNLTCIGVFRDAGDANHFNGVIDDVKIFDTALSAEQVKELYTNPFGMILEDAVIPEVADVTVAPSSITGVVSSIDPTTILGSISITPSVITGVVSSIDPAIVLGSVVVAPGSVSAVCGSNGPVVVVPEELKQTIISFLESWCWSWQD